MIGILRTLPVRSRAPVVFAAIAAVTLVTLAICLRGGSLMQAGGFGAGALAVYRGCERVLRFLRGTQ